MLQTLQQFLRVQGEPKLVNTPYNGEWPPPEHIVVLVDNDLGAIAMFALPGLPDVLRTFAEFGDTMRWRVYERTDYSKLDEDSVKTGTHLARGALYKPTWEPLR